MATLMSNDGKVASSSAVVQADGVTRRYGEGDTAVDALQGVSLEVAAGQLTAVMGPSGSGKSTLMHILAGLDRPTTGSVFLDGTEITTMGDRELTLPSAAPHRLHLSVLQSPSHALRPRRTSSCRSSSPERSRKMDWFAELAEKVGLADRLTHRPSELSGGQQQRVAIARALASHPTVVFADEPTGNLDSTTGQEILDLLRDSVDAYGQTTVMVTHDSRAAAIADRILFLADGRIVRDLGRSTPRDVLAAMEGAERQVTKVALRGLAGRKLRALLTAIAIVLGVAMISGTFILTDTIRSAFDNLFDEVYEGTDAVVSARTAFETDFSRPPPIPEELLATVREQPSIRVAAGSIEDVATLTDRNGEAITTGGAPNLAFGGNAEDQDFNPLVPDRR